jgi:putative glutamine amidotransferase
MIRIGVSACFLYPDPARTVFGHKTLVYLEHEMSRFLSGKESMPILIPDLPREELVPFLSAMDGFVFQGGADIAPSSYGETPIENGRWPGDPRRDAYELAILDWAVKNQKPVLGICRGFQLLNVYFGGTLHQDLALQTGTPVEHRNAEKYDHIFHEVECVEGGLLHDIYGRNKLVVNSVHHQGVKTLGRDLKVDARSVPDQLVEAFHHAGPVPILGVQWHPEFSHTLKGVVADPKPLLDHFLEKMK